MSNHPGFLSRTLSRGELLRICDPFSDEAAQAFLRSENVELTLDNTFKDTKIEFEDLDGLSWQKTPMPSPPADPEPLPLEPLFGPGKSSITTVIYDTDWVGVSSSPACCQCSSDRSACRLHVRKLSRSRRSSGVSLDFPRTEDPDPFAFVPMPFGQRQESDMRKGARTGTESTMGPPSVEQTESQSRPFRLLELPPEGDLSSTGPPPGLPSPRPGLQPPQGVPFPTQV